MNDRARAYCTSPIFRNLSFSSSPGDLTCGLVAESTALSLACPAGVIESVTVASYGTPAGSCASGDLRPDAKCSADIKSVISARCVGKESCTVECDGDTCDGTPLAGGDPCYGTKKNLAVTVQCSASPPPSPAPAPKDAGVKLTVTVPHGSVASIRVPLVSSLDQTAHSVEIIEGSTTIWKGGAFVRGAVASISDGFADGKEGITFAVSDARTYAFETKPVA